MSGYIIKKQPLDIWNVDFGSIWFFDPNSKFLAAEGHDGWILFPEPKYITGQGEIIPCSSFVMIVDCNAVEHGDLLPKFYKVLTTSKEGEVKIGWMYQFVAQHLIKHEQS